MGAANTGPVEVSEGPAIEQLGHILGGAGGGAEDSRENESLSLTGIQIITFLRVRFGPLLKPICIDQTRSLITMAAMSIDHGR